MKVEIIKQNVGVDVAKDDFKVALSNLTVDYLSVVCFTRTFENTMKGFKQLQEWVNLKKNHRHGISFTMEATGVYYEGLAYFLHEQNYELHVVLPNHAKHDWDGDWPALVTTLKLKGAAQQLAQQTELMHVKQGDLGMSFHLRAPMGTLCTSTNVNRLSSVLTEHFGKTVKITTEVGKVEATVNQNNINKQTKRQIETEQAVNNDPDIQALLEEFDAKIVPGSIKPI